MRWLINYLRSLWCKHDWELLDKAAVFDGDSPSYHNRPIYRQYVYRCKKCGYAKKYKC